MGASIGVAGGNTVFSAGRFELGMGSLGTPGALGVGMLGAGSPGTRLGMLGTLEGGLLTGAGVGVSNAGEGSVGAGCVGGMGSPGT